MVINHFLTWRDRCSIVATDAIGVRFFDDTKEDLDLLVNPHCPICSVEITNGNAKYCCRKCLSVGALRARWN